MKISDGFWMDKKGYDVRYVAQAYEVETTDHEIRVLATPYVVQNRGMTLAGPNLEITYSSRMENVIKVHIDHYRGGLDNKPKFELAEDEGYLPEIRKEKDSVVMISGQTRLEIALGDHWETAFSGALGRRLLCGIFGDGRNTPRRIVTVCERLLILFP